VMANRDNRGTDANRARSRTSRIRQKTLETNTIRRSYLLWAEDRDFAGDSIHLPEICSQITTFLSSLLMLYLFGGTLRVLVSRFLSFAIFAIFAISIRAVRLSCGSMKRVECRLSNISV